MRSPIRILELRSVRGTGGGPEKTILQGAASTDPRRFAVTVCYIRDARDRIFGIDARARRLGLDYVEIRERHSFDPAIWPALRQLVRHRRIDIVHAHEYKTDLLAFALARAAGIVPLATVHGWTGHTLRDRFYYTADRWLLARFPRVIAVSGEIRTVLEKAGTRRGRIATILNGIDHRTFIRDRGREAAARAALGISPGESVLGAVGRLEPQKRFDVLLDVFARLRRRWPNLRLLIAGEGGSRAVLERQIRSFDVADSCSLLGHWPDVLRLHHALDLFVQSSRYEGTPNAVLEAMALETPVVATSVGGTAELVEDGVDGLVVPPNDAAALAYAIEHTLLDRVATARRVANARARVERELSFDARMRKVEAIYEELGGRRPRWPAVAAQARRPA